MNDTGSQTVQIDSPTYKYYCRAITNAQLNRFANIGDAQVIENMSEPSSCQEARWVSVIFAAANAVRLTFKIKYIESEIKEMVGHSRGQDSNMISSNSIGDFVKEYCNVVAGIIKHTLEPVSKSAKMSIPIVTRCDDSIFFEPGGAAPHFSDSWDLICGLGTINCGISIEFFDKRAIENILLPAFESSESENGEVSFFY